MGIQEDKIKKIKFCKSVLIQIINKDRALNMYQLKLKVYGKISYISKPYTYTYDVTKQA